MKNERKQKRLALEKSLQFTIEKKIKKLKTMNRKITKDLKKLKIEQMKTASNQLHFKYLPSTFLNFMIKSTGATMVIGPNKRLLTLTFDGNKK